MTVYVYDIEVYPNVFTVAIINSVTGKTVTVEVSERKNEFFGLFSIIRAMMKNGDELAGFNNFGYDYQVIHYLITKLSPETNWRTVTKHAYAKSTDIITSSKDAMFAKTIWQHQHLVKQIDLYKIHHFDNKARATSLKVIEFNMRSEKVEDLPFPVGINLTPDQIPTLLKYNVHDARETLKFLRLSKDMIEFRRQLSAKYGKDFMNFNDTKIGKQFLIMELEKSLGESICYYFDESGQRVPRQTRRSYINLKEIILPYVKFERPEFKAVLDWFNHQVIRRTKGVFIEIPEEKLRDVVNYADLKKKKGKVANLNVNVDGLKYVFGTGGLHASIEGGTVYSDHDYQIIDLDVKSFYPRLGIVNGFFPKHLTSRFCEILREMVDGREQHAKGTPENKSLKLAQNGAYGDSNSIFSPFYDPAYTMSITINGQLLLCMLAESLMKIFGLKVIQANTDGITVVCPRRRIDDLKTRCYEWELMTGLSLEEALYSRMFIRDVNNYIAEYEDGKVKRKGAYEYERDCSQNHSALVIPKAVEQYLLNGTPVETFIKNHDDPFDFLLRTKVPRSSRLVLRGETDEPLQNVTRYYLSKNGGKLIKIMPPLKGKIDEREIGIDTAWDATPCNTVDELTLFEFDHDYYIAEAWKMIKPLMVKFQNYIIEDDVGAA